eukprot:3713419-Pleurochrysis_carterae.AAC.1
MDRLRSSRAYPVGYVDTTVEHLLRARNAEIGKLRDAVETADSWKKGSPRRSIGCHRASAVFRLATAARHAISMDDEGALGCASALATLETVGR